jgi:hypothetical protein
MHFSHSTGVITRITKQFRKGGNFRRKSAVIAPALMLMDILAAEQGVSGRGTHGIGAETILITHSFGGKGIYIRRADIPVAISTQAFNAMLIRMDNQDINPVITAGFAGVDIGKPRTGTG